MNLDLSETQTSIRDSAKRIATDLLAPVAAGIDRGENFDDFLAHLKVLGEAGFMGINVSSKYGGTEAGVVAYALTLEEVGKACASTGVTVSVTNLVGEIIESCGSEEQRVTHIPKLCDGTYLSGGFCLTEAGAGSDPSGMVTSAKRDGDEWVLNGEKLFVSSGDFAGIFVVWAVSDPKAPKGKGISCFLVTPDTDGMNIGPAERKMGQRGSHINTIHFDNCRIPADSLLGVENDGFRIAVGELSGARIGIASIARGIAVAAMDAAKRHIGQRKQFGKRIADFQGIQWQLVEHETELEAARLLILQAAFLKEQGRPFGMAASMAKLYSTEAAQRACYTALQLHGGSGYTEELPLERYVRDVRITPIYEGSNEIQRIIIAREILAQMDQIA